jgi:hypothetical protein
LQIAFPPNKKDAKVSLPWENHINVSRLAKLRSAARAEVHAELAESREMKARSSSTIPSIPVTASASAVAADEAFPIAAPCVEETLEESLDACLALEEEEETSRTPHV